MERISVYLLLLSVSFCLIVALLEANGEECEVKNLLPLTDRLNFSTTPTTNRFQIIVTSYSFTCCGNVTAWGAYINQGTSNNVRSAASGLTLDFQVWRRHEDGTCRYQLVGNNTVISPTLNASMFISNISPHEQIGFQLGDVIGVNVYATDEKTITNDTVQQRSLSDAMGFTRSFGGASTSRTDQEIEKSVSPVSCNVTSRLTLVPVITVNIVPTPCPQTATTPSATAPAPPRDNQLELSTGAIAGITISALVVVILCAIITVVCLVIICSKRSKRRKPRQKTFGKARFIRSLYILPKRYAASKDDDVDDGGGRGFEDSSSVREEVMVVLKGAEKGAGQGEVNNQETDNNEDSYVNVQDVATPIVTPTRNRDKTETETDEALYENNPFARKLEKNKEALKKEEEKEDENNELYVNQDEFKRPTSLETCGNEEDNEDELYVNTDRAREEFADLESVESPIYMNQGRSISTSTNKAYGVTTRSENLEELQQQMEREAQDNEREEEYVYVEVTPNSPEDEYHDMSTFDVQKFLKKSK